ETVIEDKTGIFFNEQTIESIIEAVERFERKEFDLKFIRKHAEKFSEDRFKTEFNGYVNEKVKEYNF
ncbi:MAG: hypothetical protein K940chlam5_01704, partial [Candidatus Anoxychlamydiales bacterium]|nr:hypothetical protein [Candidatus Anoxychlamydiales bacterium]